MALIIATFIWYSYRHKKRDNTDSGGPQPNMPFRNRSAGIYASIAKSFVNASVQNGVQTTPGIMSMPVAAKNVCGNAT